MKISYDIQTEGIEVEVDVKNVKITLNADVEYEIYTNKFGELVVCKIQYGSGDGSIVLKPKGSNVILLS